MRSHISQSPLPSSPRMARHSASLVRVACELALVFSLCPSVASSAQQRRSAKDTQRQEDLVREKKKAERVGVTVMLLDTLTYRWPDAVIVRRSSRSPHDLILMKESIATPALLASAVATLSTARKLWGDTTRRDQVIRVSTRVMPATWRRRVETAGARTLARLRISPPETIAGIGTGKVAEVYLPSRKMREARGEHAEVVR